MIARPLTTIPRARTVDADAANLAPLVTGHGVGELVVGLPLEARGNEGSMAAAALPLPSPASSMATESETIAQNTGYS